MVVILGNCSLGKMYQRNKIANLISKLPYLKIPYLMDKRGHPYRPCIHLTRVILRLEERKTCYGVTFSSHEGSTAHHQANGSNLAGLASEDTGHLFLMFGEAGRQHS